MCQSSEASNGGGVGPFGKGPAVIGERRAQCKRAAPQQAECNWPQAEVPLADLGAQSHSS